MKATGERWERRLWQKKGAERVAAVDRCQGAPSTQADVGHRNRAMTARGSMYLSRPLQIGKGERYMKATGIVRRVEARVIITQKCDKAT